MKLQKLLDFIINCLAVLCVCLTIGALSAFEGEGANLFMRVFQLLTFGLMSYSLIALQKKRMSVRAAYIRRMRLAKIEQKKVQATSAHSPVTAA